MRLLLVILLRLLQSAAQGCSLHTSVSCSDEIVAARSNYTRAVEWNASPALRYEYEYTQTDTGLFINLKAAWRVLKSEQFTIPLTAFEISLFDITENRLIEVRSVSIATPLGGILQLTDTVEFFTNFRASLEFGHEYEIELRFLPLGGNGSFKKRLSIPSFPVSGECEKDSPLALDKDKYAIFVNETRKYPFTSTVLLSFYTAPPVFCFTEYTIEVFETANPIAVYSKAIVPTTASTQVIIHEFPDLPVGIHLSIKIYPTEAVQARVSQCVCANCNCLVTQTKSFKFTPPVIKESPRQTAPPITEDDSSFLHRYLPYFVILPLLLAVIAILSLLMWFLRLAMKPQPLNVKLISDWSKDEKKPMVVTPEPRRNGAIWVIGLNSLEEHRFLHKLATYLHPSTRLIYAPDDLPDGENRWKWMSEVNRGVDSIILLLREPCLSLYSAGLSSISDPYETMFIEQLNLLHPTDHRIMTVSLDTCTPSLFTSSLIVYQDPRDFPLLTQSLAHKGFTLVDPLSTPPSPSPPTPQPITPPVSPSPSLSEDRRSASVTLRSERRISEESGIGESEDSGFASIPSSPSLNNLLRRYTLPYQDTTVLDTVVDQFSNRGTIPHGNVIVAN